MSNALAEREPQTIAGPQVTAAELVLVKQTVAAGASDLELKLYLYDCARQGVHPLDKLIHFTVRKDKQGIRKYTPITSIDFMRIRAAETNEYAGSDDAVHSGTPKTEDFTSTVTVWRLVQGTRCPFTATARWSEYKPSDDFMWNRMPHTMLAKCAEALALRKGFPRQLAGLYAKEEMDQAGESKNGNGVTVEAPKVETQQIAGTTQVTNGGRREIPDGAALILKVTPASGAAKGELTVAITGGVEKQYAVFSEQLKALAEQLCQDGTLVELGLKDSAKGKTYCTGLKRFSTVIDTADEPVPAGRCGKCGLPYDVCTCLPF